MFNWPYVRWQTEARPDFMHTILKRVKPPLPCTAISWHRRLVYYFLTAQYLLHRPFTGRFFLRCANTGLKQRVGRPLEDTVQWREPARR